MFLNADLSRAAMLSHPVDPENFDTSPRGRHERIWLMFLFVLVEAWEAKANLGARADIDSVVDTSELSELLDRGHNEGKIDSMRELRNYMAHRDGRGYFEGGRFELAGAFDFHLELHAAFDVVLLEALRAQREDD